MTSGTVPFCRRGGVEEYGELLAPNGSSFRRRAKSWRKRVGVGGRECGEGLGGGVAVGV